MSGNGRRGRFGQRVQVEAHAVESPIEDGKVVRGKVEKLRDIEADLKQTDWWNETWLESVLNQVDLHFNQACDRWRNLYRAALAIFFAIFFDMFDGRVARMTRTQSDFGVELDSLADVVSFGAAPALLVYKWALAPLGLMGLLLSFAFAACGALRLARFNVLAHRGDKSSHRFFVGLPIPLAAGTIVSLVIAHYKAFGSAAEPASRVPIAAVVALLAFLMVSTVRYRTFKDVHLSPKSLAVFVLLCAGGLAVGIASRASFVMVVYMGAYIVLGLAEWVIGWRRPEPAVASFIALEPEEVDEP